VDRCIDEVSRSISPLLRAVNPGYTLPSTLVLDHSSLVTNQNGAGSVQADADECGLRSPAALRIVCRRRLFQPCSMAPRD